MQQLENLEENVLEYLPDIFLKHLSPVSALHLAGRKNTGLYTISTAPWHEHQNIPKANY